MVQNHWGCFGGCLVSKAGASWHTLKSGLGKQRPGGSVKVQTSGHSLLKAFGVLSGAQTPPLGAAAGGAVLCLPSRQNPGRTSKGPGARMAWRSACGVGAGPQCRAYRLLGVGRGLKPFPMGSLWAEPGGLSVPRRHEVNPQAEKGCDLKPPPRPVPGLRYYQPSCPLLPQQAEAGPLLPCRRISGPGSGWVAPARHVRTAGPATSKARGKTRIFPSQADRLLALWAAS